MNELTFEWIGDQGLLVRIGNRIAPEFHQRVKYVYEQLLKRKDLYIEELVPAYTTLAVYYDTTSIAKDKLSEEITAIYQSRPKESSSQSREIVTIPACYGGDAAPDLNELAAYLNVSEQDVIDRHSSSEYLIYMMGFLPGFPYLGGMDARLATPRKATPRDKVPPGSIGIAGEQTGIYPIESPGGWNLIARTPINLFDPSKKQPFPIEMGQYIRFEPISTEEFEAIRLQDDYALEVRKE
nr:5-oxoprolinase subunit PxpB [Thalassobacillus sp. CUG 92003]